MKIILYITQTLNGIIARNNFQEDFLSDESWKTFVNLAEEKGCFVVGRKTYDEVNKWKDYNFDKIKAKKIIVSNNSQIKLNKGFILANSPDSVIKKAKELNLNTILVSGGSKLNTSFIKEGLIDEIILNVEPYLLGNGIRIFSEENFENKLKLLKTNVLKSGIIQLHYKVLK